MRRNSGPDERLRDLVRRIAAGELDLLKVAAQLHDEAGGGAGLPADVAAKAREALEALDDEHSTAIDAWVAGRGEGRRYEDCQRQMGYLDALVDLLGTDHESLLRIVGDPRDRPATPFPPEPTDPDVRGQEIVKRIYELRLGSVASASWEYPGYLAIATRTDGGASGPFFVAGTVNGPWSADEHQNEHSYAEGFGPADSHDLNLNEDARVADVVEAIRRLIIGRVGEGRPEPPPHHRQHRGAEIGRRVEEMRIPAVESVSWVLPGSVLVTTRGRGPVFVAQPDEGWRVDVYESAHDFGRSATPERVDLEIPEHDPVAKVASAIAAVVRHTMARRARR